MNKTKVILIVLILLMGIGTLYWLSLGNVEKFFFFRHIYGTTPTYYLEQETVKINSGNHCENYRFIVMRSPWAEIMPGIGDTDRKFVRERARGLFFSDMITRERGIQLEIEHGFIDLYNSALVKNCLSKK